jgi:hypothetical protein
MRTHGYHPTGPNAKRTVSAHATSPIMSSSANECRRRLSLSMFGQPSASKAGRWMEFAIEARAGAPKARSSSSPIRASNDLEDVTHGRVQCGTTLTRTTRSTSRAERVGCS